MNIIVVSDHDSCHIRMQGDMTIYQAIQCKDEFLAPIQDHQIIDVDMSGIGEIDTAGLQILALFLKETSERNIKVSFSAISPSVDEFIHFCGLDNILGNPIVTDVVH